MKNVSSNSSIQAKAAEVDSVKRQMAEMEKEREDLNNTISKLKQVCEQKKSSLRRCPRGTAGASAAQYDEKACVLRC